MGSGDVPFVQAKAISILLFTINLSDCPITNFLVPDVFSTTSNAGPTIRGIEGYISHGYGDAGPILKRRPVARKPWDWQILETTPSCINSSSSHFTDLSITGTNQILNIDTTDALILPRINRKSRQ